MWRICIGYSGVQFFVYFRFREGRCTQCSNEYYPSDDGTKCNPPSNIETVAGSIGGGLALALIIIIGLVLILVFAIEKKRKFDKYRDISIFDMRKCNMDFDYKINEALYANKMEMTFDEGQAKFIPVGEETKDIICIGNDNNDYMKIQFTTKEDTDRYEIRTNPQIIILKRYEAVEIFNKVLYRGIYRTKYKSNYSSSKVFKIKAKNSRPQDVLSLFEA